jgi:hypothetical protein
MSTAPDELARQHRDSSASGNVVPIVGSGDLMERSQAVRELQTDAEALLAALERSLAELRMGGEERELVAELDGIVDEIRTELRPFVRQESSRKSR